MSYHMKYAQNQGKCQGHWKGCPPGSSYKTEGGCWCCARGCFALCVLAIKGKEPNEKNIKDLLNSSADVDFSKASITPTSNPKFPCIGKVIGKSHYVIVTGKNSSNDGLYKIWDPSGGKTSEMKSFSAFYNVSTL